MIKVLILQTSFCLIFNIKGMRELDKTTKPIEVELKLQSIHLPDKIIR